MDRVINDSFATDIISNVNAKAYSTKQEALYLLESQLVKPVLYKQSILQNPADIYIEFGANVLKGLNKKNSSSPTLSITDTNSLNEAISFLENELKGDL
jgi:[acyl-carrier-protein] S-malonyltransferase